MGVGTRVDLFERLWLESTRDCWEWGKCTPGTCTPSPGMPLQGCLGLELAPRASYVLAQLSLGLALPPGVYLLSFLVALVTLSAGEWPWDLFTGACECPQPFPLRL